MSIETHTNVPAATAIGTLSVAWTGHREHNLANPVAVQTALRDVVRTLADSVSHSSHRGRSKKVLGIGSLADGTDVLAARTFFDQGFSYVAVVPESVDTLLNAAPKAAQDGIKTALKQACVVEIVGSSMPDLPAYQDTNAAIVERADVLIAVWNRAKANGPGGTAEVVALAQGIGIPVIRIDPNTGAVDWPNNAAWLRTPVDAALELPDPIVSLHDVRARYVTADEIADTHKNLTSSALAWTIVLHLAATGLAVFGLLLATTSHDHAVLGLSALKLLALVVAVVLAVWSRTRHTAWINARVEAEICRSFQAIWRMPKQHVSPPLAPTFASRRLRCELERAWRADPSVYASPDEAKPEYRGDAEKGEGRIGEQLEYYSRNAWRNHARAHFAERIAVFATTIAILAAVATIVLPLVHEHGVWYMVAKYLSILLPLVSAAALTFATARDSTRRSARFAEIAARLEELDRRVEHAQTWAGLGRAVTETEALLLAEVGEWYAFARYAGAVHV